MSDLRDHWTCPECGVGMCVPTGRQPEPLEHVLWDGSVCGRYELEEVGADCFGEDDQVAQNRLYLTCSICGEFVAFARLGAGSTEWAWLPRTEEVYNAFLTKHTKCGDGWWLRVKLEGETDDQLVVENANAEAERDALRAQLAALRSALMKFGEHGNGCAKWRDGSGGSGTVDPLCDCGLTAALSQASSDAERAR